MAADLFLWRSHSGLAQLQWESGSIQDCVRTGVGRGWSTEAGSGLPSETMGLSPLVPTEGPKGLQL